MKSDACSTWIEIDLDAIRQNVARLRQIAGVPVMAVVKANGYGHGIVETARAGLEGGAAWCGVARIEEALQLRQAGIQAPVLVTGYTSPLRVPEAVSEQIVLTVYNHELADPYSSIAEKMHSRLKVHAKVDTSMGRLGIFPEDGIHFLSWLSEQRGLEVEGVFTHFASADEPEKSDTQAAVARFRRLLDELEMAGLRPPLVHAANSAATLYYPQARFNLVRCGIAMYGLHPSGDALLPEGFKPALSWKTRLASIKILPAGHGVGYNARYVTTKEESIGTIAVGYADGFRRRLGNFALLGGKRVPVLGGVCMDQCMLGLDPTMQVKVGDEVVLIGKQAETYLTAEEVAAVWGTVNYEVVCGLAARVPRFYLHEK
jgi:alanine racemase